LGYRVLAKENAINPPNEHLNPSNEVWKVVWGMVMSNKVKSFLWRACRDALPKKVNFKKRKIIPMDTCEHYNGEPESALHALWKCPGLSQIWSSLPELKLQQS